MKKINKEAVTNEIVARFVTGHKRRSPNQKIYDAIASLEEGEALEVLSEEWVGNTTIATSIHNLTRLRTKSGGRKDSEYSCALSPTGRKFVGKAFSSRIVDGGYLIVRNPDRPYRDDLLVAVEKYDHFLDNYQKERPL